MAKKRTKKQKQKAKHQFTVSWEPSSGLSSTKHKRGKSDTPVKRQTKHPARQGKRKITKSEKATITAKDNNLASIKKDLIKSLMIASLVLSLEVVLYFKLQ